MPCSSSRQLGDIPSGSVRSRVGCWEVIGYFLSVHHLLNTAALFLCYGIRGAISRHLYYSIVGQLWGVSRPFLLRVGRALCDGARGFTSVLGIHLSPRELPLGQGPRSVGEPCSETS